MRAPRYGTLLAVCLCAVQVHTATAQAQIAVQPPPMKLEVIKLQYADCEEIAALFGGGSTRGFGMERYFGQSLIRDNGVGSFGQSWGRGVAMIALPGPTLWSPPSGPTPGNGRPLGGLLPEGMAGPPVAIEPLNNRLLTPQPAQPTPAYGPPRRLFPGLHVVAYPPLNALVVWGTSDQINTLINP